MVRAFWEVLKAMPLEKKKAFLTFATGSDRCAQRTPQMSPHRAAHGAHDAQKLSLSIPMNPQGARRVGLVRCVHLHGSSIASICGRCAQYDCSSRASVARKA